MLEDPILRPTLMAIIVLSASLATYPLEDMWTTVGMYSAKRRRLMRLKSLKPREKKVLGAYLQNERTTQRWSPPVGTVDILAQDRILYRVASNLGPHVYAIDDDVWKHLNANPWLVQLDRYSLV